MGVVFVDGTPDDNWLKVEYVKRILRRELTDAEEAEVLRVGTTADFFQREKAELERAQGDDG